MIKKKSLHRPTVLFGGSIGKRITYLFLGVTIFFMIFSGINQRFLNQFSRYYLTTNEQIETMRDIGESVKKSSTAFSQYLHFGNAVYKEDYLNLTNNIYQQLDEIEGEITYEEAKYLLPGIQNLMKAYDEKCRLSIEKYQKKDYSYYAYTHDIEIIENYLNSYCDQMVQLLSENASDEYYHWERGRQNWTQANGVFIILLVAITVFIIGFIDLYITRPMKRLATAARKVSAGDFRVEVSYGKEENEINLFCQVFNQMVASIQRMLLSEKEKAQTERQLLIEQQKNEEYKTLLEQTKFLALQSQTNPHFMFNTLNSIKSTVMLGKNKEAIQMLSSFAAFIRYNLQSSEKPVYLKEEVAIVKEYLKIQQIRFGDRIRMEITCEEEVLDQVRLPRFTLQPLVENAIIHGLENRLSDGYLEISIKKRKEYIAVRIMDNGIGIPMEKLTQIRQQEYVGEKRIGIDNIQKRLQIYFGRKDIFHITSEEGIGTLIVLQIPLEEQHV